MLHQYAQKMGVDFNSLKFQFDGEVLTGAQTPEDLELEDQYTIDVITNT